MNRRSRQVRILIALALFIGVEVSAARAFIITTGLDPWLVTASGTRSGRGDPVTLTWSLVPNGTSVPNGSGGNLGGSTLITMLDAEFGAGPGGNDFTQRPWFSIFTDAFGRWSEVSGATYVYEPHDDGVTHSSAAGVLGIRGDIRIAGANVDGAGNVLAFNYFPQDGGDMVLDVSEADSFDNPGPNNDFLYLRNVLMHEHGHGFGLNHVVSDSDDLLMEPSINLGFDGPQLDEVRGIQYYFGDAYEKTNGGQGNDTAALATSLGSLTSGVTRSVGADAAVPDQFIEPTAIDFVSIANLNDTDFFSFSVSQHAKLSAVLTPRGGQFNQSGQFGTPTPFDANARADLSLAIFDLNGTSLLHLANSTGLGGMESILNLDLPAAGQYYARITGAQDTIQMYDLALTAIVIQPADFDEDGDVDGDDLDLWELAYGATNLGDADNDGDSDGSDFLVWQQQYTGEVNPLAAVVVVPEPSAALLVMSSLALGRRSRRWPYSGERSFM